MVGHLILEAAPYDPDTLGLLFKAFDGAWDEIKAEVGELPDGAEAARSALAMLILDLAKPGIIADAEQLKEIAVKAFRAARGPRKDRRCAGP